MRDELRHKLSVIQCSSLLSIVIQEAAKDAIARINALEAECEKLRNKPAVPNERLCGYTRKPVAIVMLRGPSECHLFDNVVDALNFQKSHPDRFACYTSLNGFQMVWHTTGENK